MLYYAGTAGLRTASTDIVLAALDKGYTVCVIYVFHLVVDFLVYYV
jgi:hypothetical protein